MILKIDDSQTVSDLQEKFSQSFPLLKLEFYAHKHKWKRPSVAKDLIKPTATVGSIRKEHDPGLLEIRSSYQTGKVERDFRELFGLHVQIFRKTKRSWVQTISTDNFTLAEQMEIASRSIAAGKDKT
jgi:hypothetical protein